MTTTVRPDVTPGAADEPEVVGLRHKPLTPARVVLQLFLLGTALVWLFPLLLALFNSLRDYAFTSTNGYFSFGGFTLKHYTDAWDRGNFTHTFLNSVYITVPAVLLT
ncbi:MAG: carbohydrate ABC transporter permease, partial [Alphaproteobacteria bacterium]